MFLGGLCCAVLGVVVVVCVFCVLVLMCGCSNCWYGVCGLFCVFVGGVCFLVLWCSVITYIRLFTTFFLKMC
jgi:hypothetical protein